MICHLIVFSNWNCLSWSFKSEVIPPSPMVLLQCVPTLVQCCCGWQLVQAKCKVAMVHNSCTIGGFQLVQDAGAGCRVQGSQDQSAAEVKEPKYIGAAAASTVLQFFSNNISNKRMSISFAIYIYMWRLNVMNILWFQLSVDIFGCSYLTRWDSKYLLQ